MEIDILTFTLDRELFGVTLKEAEAVLSDSRVFPCPAPLDGVRGFIRREDGLVAVVDGPALVGGASADAPGDLGCVIVLRSPTGPWALGCTTLEGVARVDADRLERPGRDGREAPAIPDPAWARAVHRGDPAFTLLNPGNIRKHFSQ